MRENGLSQTRSSLCLGFSLFVSPAAGSRIVSRLRHVVAMPPRSAKPVSKPPTVHKRFFNKLLDLLGGAWHRLGSFIVSAPCPAFKDSATVYDYYLHDSPLVVLSYREQFPGIPDLVRCPACGSHDIKDHGWEPEQRTAEGVDCTYRVQARRYYCPAPSLSHGECRGAPYVSVPPPPLLVPPRGFLPSSAHSLAALWVQCSANPGNGQHFNACNPKVIEGLPTRIRQFLPFRFTERQAVTRTVERLVARDVVNDASFKDCEDKFSELHHQTFYDSMVSAGVGRPAF